MPRRRGIHVPAADATSAGGTTLDVTPWLRWFLACLDRAFDRVETILGTVMQKARFWETHSTAPLNERQRAILNRLLDGFEGKLTLVEVREAREVLARHGAAGHR